MSMYPNQAFAQMVKEFRRLETLEGNEPIRCSRMHFRGWADTLEAALNHASAGPVPRQATSASAQAELERANHAEAVLRYELALAALEGEIRKLRDENTVLKSRLVLTCDQRDRLRNKYMRPPVFSFMGFHMESADIDG